MKPAYALPSYWQSCSLDNNVSGMQHASSVAPLWFVGIFDCNISELQFIWFLAIAADTAGNWRSIDYRTQHSSIEVWIIEHLDSNNHVTIVLYSYKSSSTKISNFYIILMFIIYIQTYPCINVFVKSPYHGIRIRIVVSGHPSREAS